MTARRIHRYRWFMLVFVRVRRCPGNSGVTTRLLVRTAHFGCWRAGALRARSLPARGVASCRAWVLRSGTCTGRALVPGSTETAASAATQQLAGAKCAPWAQPAHAELTVRAVRTRVLRYARAQAGLRSMPIGAHGVKPELYAARVHTSARGAKHGGPVATHAFARRRRPSRAAVARLTRSTAARVERAASRAVAPRRT